MVLSKLLRRGIASVSVASTTSKTLKDVPSPKGALPLLGHYLQIRGRQGNLSSLYESYFEELGPIFKVHLPGGKCIVCFADPDSVETVYRNEGSHPIRTYSAPANFQWFYGRKNLPVPFLFLTGSNWKEARSKHIKQSTVTNARKYIPGFITATNQLLRNIKNASMDDGYIENVHPLILNWSMEVSAYFVLGAELDLMKTASDSSNEEVQEFQKGIRTLISTIDDFSMALPFFKIFPSKIMRDLEEATNDLYRIGQKYVELSIKSEEKPSLLKGLINDGNMSQEEAIMSSIFMFGAGTDTTPSNTSFILYELAKHKDVQEKLYDQVTSVLGERGEADSESLQKMPYLGQVIKETQRLYPISPHHIRTLPQDIDILGYTIPAQTLTMYSMLAVGKSKKYFKDPMKFDPERWSRDSIHPFALLPFGVGIRSCWGRRLAEIEMKILLSEICRHFVLESNEPGDSRLKRDERLFSRPGEVVKIRFIPRN